MEGMNNGKSNGNGKWVAGVVTAALAGIAVGVLLAPKAGKETRATLRTKFNNVKTRMNSKSA